MTTKTKLLGTPVKQDDTAAREMFEEHLRSEGYSDTTIKASKSALATLLRLARAQRKMPPSFLPHARRAARWVLSQGGHLEITAFGRWLQRELPAEPVPPPDPKARDKVESLDPALWVRLREQVMSDNTLEALAVRVLMATTMRIGAVLDQPIGALAHALVASDAVFANRVRKELSQLPQKATLRERMSPVPGSRSPYIRVYNYVTQLSERLGVDFSLNAIARTAPGVRKGRAVK